MVSQENELPQAVREFAEKYPQIWDAYNQLGKAAAEAGPLDERTQRLVKLALAVGAGRQGAVHSQVRRALKAGVTADELIHVGLLAITTIGWSGAFAAITWMMDVLSGAKE